MRLPLCPMPPALCLLCQYRRSDGTGELGLGRNLYFLACFCFQCFYHADVFGDTARHHDRRFKADPISHGDDSGGYTATLPPLIAGKWYLQIEPKTKEWRLTGRITLPAEKSVQLGESS